MAINYQTGFRVVVELVDSIKLKLSVRLVATIVTSRVDH